MECCRVFGLCLYLFIPCSPLLMCLALFELGDLAIQVLIGSTVLGQVFDILLIRGILGASLGGLYALQLLPEFADSVLTLV